MATRKKYIWTNKKIRLKRIIFNMLEVHSWTDTEFEMWFWKKDSRPWDVLVGNKNLLFVIHLHKKRKSPTLFKHWCDLCLCFPLHRPLVVLSTVFSQNPEYFQIESEGKQLYTYCFAQKFKFSLFQLWHQCFLNNHRNIYAYVISCKKL